jgi:N6-adenosine-specific RNA methylase IME4
MTYPAPFEHVQGGPFGVLLCDPPWAYRDKCHAGKRGACYKYETMTYEQLAALPVMQLAAPDCLLAMWWVPPMPLQAINLILDWDFRLVTMCGFTWVKTTTTGKWAFGMGHWTRGNAENCLFAIRGKPKRVSAAVSQLIVAPVREHSRKPDAAYDRLEQLIGDVPRIELFARRARPNWTIWGNEAPTTAMEDAAP